MKGRSFKAGSQVLILNPLQAAVVRQAAGKLMRELLRGASSGFLTIRHRRCSHQLRNSPTNLPSAGIVGL